MKTLKNFALCRFLQTFLTKKFPLSRCSPWILVWKTGKGMHVICELFTFSDLVCSTTRVRHKWLECNTSVIQVQYECYMNDLSATRVRYEWKNLILITTQMKIYFHTPILAIWQMKDYKERNIFILRTTFWECLAPVPKCIWKVDYKNWTL